MERIELLVRPAGLVMKVMAILLLTNSMVPAFAYAATGTPCNAVTVISSQINWLNQNSNHYVTGVVVSNKPHTLFGTSSQVTYARIGLKKGAGLLLGWLVSSAPGNQLFDDRVWYGNNFDAHPFSPFATDSVTMTVTPSGTVTIGSSGFSTACLNGVLYGGPNPPSNSSIVAIGQTYPLFAITFEQGTIPSPPK